MVSIPQSMHEHWDSALKHFRDPVRRSWILLNPTSIGDTYITCAFAKAFRATHGGLITMVVKEEQRLIPEMFPGDIDRIVVWDADELHQLCNRIQRMCTFSVDNPIIAHPYWHGDGRLGEFLSLSALGGGRGILFTDMFRHILRVSWDTELATPCVPEKWQREALSLCMECGVVPGESVVLFPENNSVSAFPEEIWERIGAALVKAGKTVFTNCYGSSKGHRAYPVAGTRSIIVPLHLATPIVNLAGRAIGGANGLVATMVAHPRTANITNLIYASESQAFRLNGMITRHPVAMQSIVNTGVGTERLTEFVVDPDHCDDALIQQIVANRESDWAKSDASIRLRR